MKNSIINKKIMSIVLITIMLLTTKVCAASDSYNTTLKANSLKVKRGENITITIGLKNIEIESGDKGIGAYTSDIKFDESVLEYVSTNDTVKWEAPLYQGGLIAGNTKDGKVAKDMQDIGTITFKVKKDAKLGETTIRLTNFSGSTVVNDVVAPNTTIKLTIEDNNNNAGNNNSGNNNSGNTNSGNNNSGNTNSGNNNSGNTNSGNNNSGNNNSGNNNSGNNNNGNNNSGNNNNGNNNNGNNNNGNNSGNNNSGNNNNGNNNNGNNNSGNNNNGNINSVNDSNGDTNGGNSNMVNSNGENNSDNNNSNIKENSDNNNNKLTKDSNTTDSVVRSKKSPKTGETTEWSLALIVCIGSIITLCACNYIYKKTKQQ